MYAIIGIVRVTIEKIVYPGKSLSRPGEKVILTDEGLPGEEVEIERLCEKKNYIEAKTTGVVKPSPHRVRPKCGHYKICGPYQYIDYAFQVETKTAQLKEIFSRELGIDNAPVIFRPSAQAWNYRNKIDLHVIRKNGEPSFAYHALKSPNTFVKVSKCFLAYDEINRFLESFVKIIAEEKLYFIKKLVVRAGSKKKELVLAVYCNRPKAAKDFDAAFDKLERLNSLKGALLVDIITSRKIILCGEDFIEENVGGKVFYFGVESFFQINVPMVDALIKDLSESLSLKGNETLADLYCGVGTFGISLAQKASRVIGVEEARENIPFLKRNIGANSVSNFTVREGKCLKLMPEILKDLPAALIIDPPRKGLDKGMCEGILKNPAGKIAYISCNPSMLARDLKKLLSAYKLKCLYAYDFFPQTPHIETLAVLEK